jgi:hypothetical protein
MATAIRQLRGTASEIAATVWPQGVITVDETNNRIRVHDGVTPGGFDAGRPGDEGITNEMIAEPATPADGIASHKLTHLTARDGGEALSLKSRLDSDIRAVDFGEFGPSINVAPAIQAAINAASARGGGIVHLPLGTFVSSSITLPRGVTLQGQGSQGTTLQPASSMQALISVTGGFTAVRDIAFVNISNRATRAISVSKPSGDLNLPTDVAECFFTGFTAAYFHALGDCFYIRRCLSISCGVFVDCIDDGRNSRIVDNYVLGGNGIRFAKNLQGAEGVWIAGNCILPATGGTFAIALYCGLEMAITGNILDQVVTGQAIIIQSPVESISAVKITDNWLGRQLGAAGADYGLYITGNVTNVRCKGNTYTGFTQAGINVAGAGARAAFSFSGEVFYAADKNLRDIQLTSVNDVLIEGCSFSGSGASIVENAGVSGRVRDCSFGATFNPSNIGLGLRYSEQTTGMMTRNKGTVTIPSSGTAQTVTHGLSYQPGIQDIRITANAPGSSDPGHFIVTNITATTFVISPRSAPGSDIGVGWEADITR